MTMSDKTKVCKCVDCGTNVEVSKFMSATKVKCSECKEGRKTISEPQKEENGPTTTPEPQKTREIPRKAKEDIPIAPVGVGRVDGKPNKALMNLCCPFHTYQKMEIIGVIKSEKWGDIVDFQCRVRGCWCKVTISQQNQHIGPVKTTGDGLEYEADEVLEQLKNGNGHDIAVATKIEQKESK
jgi:hypothetical protein